MSNGNGERKPVQIPSGAVAGNDIEAPTLDMLRGLNLVPTNDDLRSAGGIGATFPGPPDSVALIEAGATALSKWWAVAFGGGAVAVNLLGWWKGQDSILRWGIVVATAALVVAIGYIVGSDVRGRAAAMCETIRARATLAEAMIGSARSAHDLSPSNGLTHIEVLQPPLPVKNTDRHHGDQDGWKAVAFQVEGDHPLRYLVAKGRAQEWVAAASVAPVD